MKRLATAVILVLLLFIGLYLVFGVVWPLLSPRDGYLQVSSSIPTKVKLDSKELGDTPYREGNLPIGDHKLTLEGTFATGSAKVVEGKKVTWTTNISLSSNTLSVINVDFGPSSEFTASEVLTLKKGSTSISIASNPQKVEVELDGTSIGETPIVKDVKAGAHRLKFSKNNYLERQIDINVQEGYQTVIQINLSLNPLSKTNGKINSRNSISFYNLTTSEKTLSNKPTNWATGIWYFQEKASSIETKFDALIDKEGNIYYYDEANFKDRLTANVAANVAYLGIEEEEKPSEKALSAWESLFPVIKVAQVEILETPTGTLNLRETASTSAKILTKVNPGEKYELLEEASGWFKIKVGSSEGWVSSQYAKKI